MDDLRDAVAFHQLLLNAEGASPLTQRQYLFYHCLYLDYLAGRGIKPTFAALNPETVREFLVWYRARPHPRRTRGGEVAVRAASDILKRLGAILEDQEILDDNPLRKLHRPKITRFTRQPFTVQELNAMWGACFRTQHPARDEALFLLLLDTGMRIGEACSLRMDRLDLDMRQARVGTEGKSRRERLVPIGSADKRDGGRTIRALRRYLQLRGEGIGEHDQYVFLARDRHRLTAAGGNDVIKRVAALAGVEDAYPHRLRHAQPVYSPVLTPNGWRPIGDIKVGDRVIGLNGRQTSVTGVYPQGEQEVMRVYFSDGASVECTLDHLWAVRPSLSKCWPRNGDHWRTMSTRDIVDEPGPWHTPVVQPIDVNRNRDVPIDPYTLGALLGDGHFGISPQRGARGTGQSRSGGLVLACDPAETEVIERIAAALPARHRVSGRPGRYLLVANQGPTINRVGSNRLMAGVRRLGLGGIMSTEKHIPRAYFRASLQDRTELLRGLMDTDGYASKAGTAVFTTISPELAAGVVELVRSLGGIATVAVRPPYADAKHDAYRVGIRTPFNPFHMTRKKERYGEASRVALVRTIKRIEPVGVAECVCIQVAAPNGLYVTQDYVVTHNTYCTWYLTMYPGDELGLRRIVGHVSRDVLADYVHFAQTTIAERVGRASPVEAVLGSPPLRPVVR